MVIGVDEAQNLYGDKHSLVGSLLLQLHADKHNLPVIVVLAGRSDSVTRVEKLGLSRLYREHIYSLDGLDEQEVEELKQEFCNYFQITDYFYDRLSDEIRESMILLSSVMKKLTKPLASWNVIDIIEQQSKLAKRRAERLPRGMMPEDYFDHLRHCGVLEQSKRYSVTCPIPSFRQFLITLPD